MVPVAMICRVSAVTNTLNMSQPRFAGGIQNLAISRLWESSPFDFASKDHSRTYDKAAPISKACLTKSTRKSMTADAVKSCFVPTFGCLGSMLLGFRSQVIHH